MKRVIIIAALIAAGPAIAADMVHKSGRLTVRLMQGECQNPALSVALTVGGGLTAPKALIASQGSIEARGCWSVDSDGDVLIADETGSSGYLPMSAFKAEPGV